MKVNIDMGVAARGAVAEMDLEELLATRLLVQGNSGSGKSHLLRRLLEQSVPWVQQCIIDPEGDFVTLADKFGHQVVDAARTEAELTRIAGRVRQHRVSVVLNLEGLWTRYEDPQPPYAGPEGGLDRLADRRLPLRAALPGRSHGLGRLPGHRDPHR